MNRSVVTPKRAKVGAGADVSASTSVWLPEDILIELFRKLSPADVGRCRRVCQDWNKACENNGIWKALANSSLKDTLKYSGLTSKLDGFSWRKFYTSFHNMRVQDGIVLFLRVVDSAEEAKDESPYQAPQKILEHDVDNSLHTISRRQLIRLRVTLINTSSSSKSLPLISSHHSYSHRSNIPQPTPANVFVSGDAFRQVVRKDDSTFCIRPADWITYTSAVDSGWENHEYVTIKPGEVCSYDVATFFTYGWENVSLKSKTHQDCLIQYASRPKSLTFIRDHKCIAKQFVVDSTTRAKDEETSPRAFASGTKFRLCVSTHGSISNFLTFKVDHGKHTPTSPATPQSRLVAKKEATKGLQPKVLFPVGKK